MPHKKAKKSVRDAATAAAGYDNPPKVGDSIPHPNHPTPSTSGPIGVLAPDEKKKRKKKALPKDKLNTFGGRNDLGGLSKSAHRILNAGAVREAYHAEKKRKREEEEKGMNPNKKKIALTPLPYESLSTFNRRVEVALRPSIDTAIRASKASSQKKKGKKAAPLKPEDDPEQNADLAGPEPTSSSTVKGKTKEKATPTTSVDPFVPKKRNGPTEFEEATQVRNVMDIVQAPPTLTKAKRGLKGTSITEALPASRMPVSGALKMMMEAEREKAIKGYREMKEKRDSEQRAAK